MPIPDEVEFAPDNEFSFIEWNDNYRQFKALMLANDRLRLRRPGEDEQMEVVAEAPKVIAAPKKQPKPTLQKSRRSQGF